MPLLLSPHYPNPLRSQPFHFHTSNFQIRQRRYRRRHHLQINVSLDDFIKNVVSTNPINLLPSSLALVPFGNRLPNINSELVVADWILFTSASPFNRSVFLRCPSISCEDGEGGDTLRPQISGAMQHKMKNEEFENESVIRGRILGRNLKYLVGSYDFEYQRVCVKCEDGGVISLDWPENLEIGKMDEMDITVMIVAGNSEGSLDDELRWFVGDVLRNGHFPIVVNPRGCGQSPLTTPRLFTAADSDDISTAIDYINEIRPGSTLVSVGFGYGAIMLTKYLSEVEGSAPITSAACIDCPFDLEETTRSSPHCPQMDEKLLGGLIEILRENKELFHGKAKEYDIAKALSATSIRDFDEAISMLSFGFDNVSDFYSMTNVRKLIPKLKVPVLFIQNGIETVSLFTVPRRCIANNPFTSLLLFSGHHSIKGKLENSAILWCQQLTIQWLSAVELTLMKGRHPLLKDIDIAIRPPKDKSFINGEPVNPVPNITHKNIDSSKQFLNSMDVNNRTMQSVTSETSVDNFAHGRDDRVSSSLNSEGLGETLMENSENAQDTNTDASQDGMTDAEKSMDLQTATVIMNMLDVTMPGTLDEECKKKVLSAMEQGKTLMNALEGAVPEDVREKLKSSVSEIMLSPKTNFEFHELNNVDWIQNVISEKSNADDTLLSDQGNVTENDSGTQDTSEPAPNVNDEPENATQTSGINTSDEKVQETVEPALEFTADSQERTAETSASNETDERMQENTESAPISDAAASEEKSNADDTLLSDQGNLTENASGTHDISEPAPNVNDEPENATQTSGINTSDENVQETVEPASEVTEDSPERSAQASASNKTDERMQENTESAPISDDEPVSEEKVTQAIFDASGEGIQQEVSDSALENGSIDKKIESSETREVDSPEQNIPVSSAKSEEPLSTAPPDSGDQVDEKSSEVQMNESENNQESKQSIQISEQTEENASTPPVSVTQAVDALIGGDDSTHMAVNSVFGVLEQMIDQYEKASTKDGKEVNTNEDNNNEAKNHQEDNGKAMHTDQYEKASTKDGKEVNTNEDNDNEAKNHQEDNGKAMHTMNHALVNSGKGHERNSHRLASSENSIGLVKDSKQLNMVGHAPVEFSEPIQTAKPLDLDSTTDLFLDQEEGQWDLHTNEIGEIENKDELYHSADSDVIVDIIEPSNVIVDDELHQSKVPEELFGKHDGRKKEISYLVKNNLLQALRIEFGRILGIHDLEYLENNIIMDLDRFSDAVSHVIVHENMVDMELGSKCIDTADHIILGKIEAADVIKIISSTLSETSHLRKAIPSGNIVDACLASLRTYFLVVPLDDDHNVFVDKHRNELVNAPAYIKDQHVDSDSLINEGSEESLEKNIKTGGIMVGAFTAALGASALVAQNQKQNGQSMDSIQKSNGSTMQENTPSTSSFAEKAMSVVGPVVPRTGEGELDQDRLVGVLVEVGQKGGMLRLVGKAALLWGGIRGAMSLTNKLIAFLHLAQRPLLQRFVGFICMALVLWSPIVIPFLPTIVQSWTANTPNVIVEYACILGLYVSVTILVVLWGTRIREYKNPLQQYGLQLTPVSRLVKDFLKGLVGGIIIVLGIHSMNSLLGYAKLSWPESLSSNGSLALFKICGSILFLALRALFTAIGISVVEELLFRSWLVEEIAVDLGYDRAMLLSAVAFSLSQRSLPSIPGIFLLSLALSGMKQRSGGSLSAPIGMRAGVMTANVVLQNGGFLKYWPHTPFWIGSNHIWHPFEGAVGVCSCALLALLFFPRRAQAKDTGDL